MAQPAGGGVVSCVVQRGAAESGERDDIYVAARVALHKMLQLLRLVDAIPKSVYVKSLRRQLRDEFRAREGQDGRWGRGQVASHAQIEIPVVEYVYER